MIPPAEAKVCFGVTSYGAMWAPAVETWLRVIGYTSRYLTVESLGKVAGIGLTDRMYTSAAGNRLVEGMLAQPDATHLFLTEVDMLLPDDCIIKLLACDQDIVSGVYFLRAQEPLMLGQPCLYRQVVLQAQRHLTEGTRPYSQSPVTLFPQETPFKLGDERAAGCAGLGCVLIKRRVFEKMAPPWFRVLENRAGSDLYFYRHAYEAGFDLWVHPQVQASQIDYYITGIEDYRARVELDPTFAGAGYIIGSNQEP